MEQFTTDSQDQLQISEGDPRTGTFPQMWPTAGDTTITSTKEVFSYGHLSVVCLFVCYFEITITSESCNFQICWSVGLFVYLYVCLLRHSFSTMILIVFL